MFRFIESRLCFEFGAPWNPVVHWDAHPAYRRGLHGYQSTAAVDFLALYGSCPTLIEVKNFRDYRIENKSKFSSGSLAKDVADKVRDTIAGAVWARDRPHDERTLGQILRHVFGPKTRYDVVLWLEEDLEREPAEREALVQRIEQRLRWLNPHVIIRNRATPLPGLSVRGASEEEIRSAETARQH